VFEYLTELTDAHGWNVIEKMTASELISAVAELGPTPSAANENSPTGGSKHARRSGDLEIPAGYTGARDVNPVLVPRTVARAERSRPIESLGAEHDLFAVVDGRRPRGTSPVFSNARASQIRKRRDFV
jgi:hypothetical protein